MKQILIKKPSYAFISLCAIGLMAFQKDLLDLFVTASDNERYSHAVLVPFISGYFLFTERKRIFQDSSVSPAAVYVLAASIAVFIVTNIPAAGLKPDERLFAAILSSVAFFAGAFMLCFGSAAGRAVFPLGFLLFMVPLPEAFMDSAVFFLQSGSTAVSDLLFRAVGAPVVRDGFFFNFPGLRVEVASECSGIRSSIALLITGAIASHMFLKTAWRQLFLIAWIIPLAIIKNGLRITTLTLAGFYIDESALTGPLHNRGGFIFFLMALGVFGLIMLSLIKSEKKAFSK